MEGVMLQDKEVRTYRKQCPYCKLYFYNPQSKRVTCGQELCLKARDRLSTEHLSTEQSRRIKFVRNDVIPHSKQQALYSLCRPSGASSLMA